MVLDASLFTLTFQRRSNDPTILDLVPFQATSSGSNGAALASSSTTDPNSSSSSQPSPLYSFLRIRSSEYHVQLQDHLTGIALSSIDAPSSSDKIRKITMYNPEETIILEKKQMTFRQEWRWTWQEQDFLIRKDGSSLIVEAVRKPEPEIDVARYTARNKAKPAFLQVLDYNIQRLEEVTDRRGLEVLILTAFCTLLDLEYDEKHKDGPNGNIYLSGYSSLTVPVRTHGGGGAGKSRTPSPSGSSQNLNKSNAGSSLPAGGAARASASATIATEPNEIPIDPYTPNEAIIQHALQLLRQDQGGEGLHLIILKAATTEATPKAVQVAAEIKARWYRLEPVAKGRTLDPMPGSTSEIAEELYQYVRDPSISSSSSGKQTESTKNEEETPPRSGPRPRIKLDAPSATPASAPPNTSSSSSFSQPNSHHTQKNAHQQKPAFLPPPSQLDVYLSKEKLDEFEVQQRRPTPSSSSSSATPRPNVQPAAALGSSNTHNSSGPASTPPKPVIPPKGKVSRLEVVMADSMSGRKLLGKLGLRKGPSEGD